MSIGYVINMQYKWVRLARKWFSLHKIRECTVNNQVYHPITCDASWLCFTVKIISVTEGNDKHESRASESPLAASSRLAAVETDPSSDSTCIWAIPWPPISCTRG